MRMSVALVRESTFDVEVHNLPSSKPPDASLISCNICLKDKLKFQPATVYCKQCEVRLCAEHLKVRFLFIVDITGVVLPCENRWLELL